MEPDFRLPRSSKVEVQEKVVTVKDHVIIRTKSQQTCPSKTFHIIYMDFLVHKPFIIHFGVLLYSDWCSYICNNPIITSVVASVFK